MPIKFADHNPHTLEEAVDILVKSLDDEEIQFVKDAGTSMLHFSLGMAMRNGWKLWDPLSTLHNHFLERFGLAHADDMSGLILYGAENVILGIPVDYQDRVETYKQYWINNDDELNQRF